MLYDLNFLPYFRLEKKSTPTPIWEAETMEAQLYPQTAGWVWFQRYKPKS